MRNFAFQITWLCEKTQSGSYAAVEEFQMSRGSNDEEAGRARVRERRSVPVQQVFVQDATGQVHELMNVRGLQFREARDSEAHPDSVDVAFFSDLTGSMGEVRRILAYEVLPRMQAGMIDVVPDAQVCFGGFGDYEHYSDGIKSWQVGQYEADGALSDTWLTRLCMCGGGTPSESAELAFYFVARLVRTDAWEKRQRKGYLFVTTDDTMRSRTRASTVNGLLGREEMDADMETIDLVREAQQTKHCFVLVQPHRTRYGGRSHGPWNEPYNFGDVVGCYEHFLGAPYVVVPPNVQTTDVVATVLMALTEGVCREPKHVRQMLGHERYNIKGASATEVLKAVARYGNFLYPDAGWQKV